jgi:hypothetical protein
LDVFADSVVDRQHLDNFITGAGLAAKTQQVCFGDFPLCFCERCSFLRFMQNLAETAGNS